MSVSRVVMLCAIGVALVGALTVRVSAQTCDDRYPATCQPRFSAPWFDGRPPGPPGRRGMPPGRIESAPLEPIHPGFFGRQPEPDSGRYGSDSGRYGPDSGRFAGLYGPVGGEPFPIPAINLSQIDPQFLRQSVHYPTNEPAGTIIINPRERFLYLVQGGGRAIRYGVGVGRQGFGWAGVADVREKREWPDWYPPKEMIERQPELRRQLTDLQSGIGMAGGPRNPLGPRALYLWQGNKDTLFRIHGTVEPWTIGRSVSSGCIRMINQDVIDLYQRTPVGAKVVVLGSGGGGWPSF